MMAATTVAPEASATWRALGCDIRLVVTEPGALDRAQRLLAADLDALDRAASRFRADSEVSALAAARGRPVRVSPTLADAVAAALAGAELSGGDLDPTMGTQLASLGYDRTFGELGPAEPPPSRPARLGTPLDVRRTATWHDVQLDQHSGTVSVPAGVMLDLGATAKARCADLAAARIAGALGCGVLVSLGGDIAADGPAPEGGWVVRVQDVTGDPLQQATGSPTCLVSITSGGLATSSTAARRWSHAGSLLHHILDPRTTRPADDRWRTVSVAAPSCLLANIASTTAVIRGHGAQAWLTELGLPARLVARAQQGARPPIVLMGGWPPSEEVR